MENKKIIKNILTDLTELTKELKTKKRYVVKTILGNNSLDELENFLKKTHKLTN